jgi:virulence-associated protein VapD
LLRNRKFGQGCRSHFGGRGPYTPSTWTSSKYGDPYNNAYLEIRKVLQRHGFTWQQGSVYFGGEAVTAVTRVLAAMDLARSLPWFTASVRDIRMLRIEELNDLMPAVQRVADEDA